MSTSVMEELLECKLCSNRLQRPRMLSCQHTFCLSCLQALVQPTNDGKQSNHIRIVAILFLKPCCLVGAYRSVL
jgi:hypothetical protein